MDREYLEEVILDQNNNLKKKNRGLYRDKLQEMDRLIKNNINVVITGHRRCGKSTLLYQIMDKYFTNNFYYLNFADERLSDFETKDFQRLREIFLSNFGDRPVFFFDEIQGKPNWNKFVNRMYEDGYKFFITGSNSELLSKEISTYLTGRHIDAVLYPFSFKEYLRYNKIPLDFRLTKNRSKIIREFNNYLRFGGFPEVIRDKSDDILISIYNDILNRDITFRYPVEQVIKSIAQFLISNVSKEFSYNSIKNNFGLGSVNTAKKYVMYLTNTYMLFTLDKFSYSIKRKKDYSKKIYAIDTGLINKIAFKFSEDKGRLYENLVFIELKRRNKEIYFWKGASGKEIDFLVFDKKVKQLIQVCYDLSHPKTKEREITALLEASKELKCKDLVIITKDYEKIEIYGKIKIKYIPLWKWLLK